MKSYALLCMMLLIAACRQPSMPVEGLQPMQREGSRATRQELSNQKVTALAEDALGHIWIGTFHGLNRYDSHEYHQYFYNDSDSASLPDNQIQDILRDSKGQMWIATVSGLCRYTDQDCFRRVDIEGPNHNAVQLLETPNGRILVNFVVHLGAYNPQTNRVELVYPLFDPDDTHYGRCYIDREGNLWDAKPYSLRRYDTDALRLQDSIPTPFRVECSYMDAEGRIWMGGLQALACYDTRTRRFATLPPALQPQRLPAGETISLLHSYGPAGSLLMGTDQHDILYYYHAIEGTLSAQNEAGFPFDLPRGSTRCLMTDSRQNLWIGSLDQGLSCRYHYQRRFNYDTRLQLPLEGKSVTSLCTDEAGRLWAATLLDGIYVYDPATHRMEQMGGIQGLKKKFTWIAPGRQGTVWIATGGDRVMRCRYTGGQGLQIEKSYTVPNAMSMVQMADGTLMVTTASAYLYVLRPGADEMLPIQLWHTSFTFTSCALPMEQEGKLLVAGFGQGLLYVDIATLNLERLPISDTDWKAAIRHSKFIPTALCADSRGRIWIGTVANGLLCYHPDTHRLQSVPGTSCPDICSICEDRMGNLWISTMNGLNRLDPTNMRNTNYFASDGLGGNQFYDRAACQLADGTMVFGGTHGVSFFNPLEHTLPRTVTLAFQELKVWGRPVCPDADGGSPIDRHLSHRPDVRLRHDQNSFSLSFAALDYAEHPRLHYHYRLEGFDRYWIDAGSVHEAFYANLPAGTYTFRVKATSDGRGDTTGAETSLRVIVHPAPWLTWWAKCLYLLLAGGIVGIFLRALHRIREGREAARRAVLEKEQEKRVNRMNMSFFANVSHEFRTPLTMIAGPVEQLSHDPSLSDSQRHLLDTVKRSVVRMLRLVNQLMDFNKLENDTLRLAVGTADIVAELRHQVDIFSVNAREKGITLTAFGLEESLSLPLDTDKLDKIITNLLSNAIKFTPTGGQIELHLDLIPAPEAKLLCPEVQTTTGSYVKMVVADTGRGIPPEQMERIFKRYYQVESADGRGSYNWGTGIGLYYARALARLHHGYLWAANRTDVASGAQFTLLLPAGESAYSADEHLPDTTSQSALYPLHPTASPAPAPATDANQQSVLVVDDDSEVTRYLEALLSPHFRVICRFDADSAFRAMQEEAPDLVLSDVVMPGKTGYELCKEIKGDMQLCHIPVVLLTAKTTDENKIEGLETGADAYVTKPFNPTYLLALIRSQLTNRQRLKQILNTATHTDALEAEDLMPQDKAFMDELYALMESELSNSELDVSIMTERMHISRTKFYYKVKGLTGENPATFFRTYKLNRAAQLLQEGEHTISEVADLCGFSTLSHFSASFKKKFGCTPSEYVRR